MNIFVGNLSFEAKEKDVERAFSAFGLVTSVAIVMEKKGKKSRGFGFVEMPDEQEALAAIAQLQGQEILGRPVNVMPALSKEPKNKPVESTGRINRNSAPPVNDNSPQPPDGASNFRYAPPLRRTGKYKEGRRTLSYLRKRMEAGITAPVPKRSHKSNPMRWRKKSRWEKPAFGSEGELKPWQRPQTESNPWKKPRARSDSWKKPEGESKPWEKSRGGSKPWIKSERKPSGHWKKPEGESKPWEKSRGGSKPWIKSERKPSGPWKKTEGESKPWDKHTSEVKPWRKSGVDRQPSRFKKRSRFSKS